MSFSEVFYVFRAERIFYFRVVTIKKLRRTVIETHVFDRTYTFSPNRRRES